MNTAIQTFTGNSLDEIVNKGGDWEWTLNEDRAKTQQYLVCCSSVGVNRGSGFLVGKIESIDPAQSIDPAWKEDRFFIRISEWAKINIPDLSTGNRNPVRYTSLENLRINLSDLKFEKIPKVKVKPLPSDSLTIAVAKAGLAKHYEVSPDNIEITIKY
jgi:hypothetical protein